MFYDILFGRGRERHFRTDVSSFYPS
jgi:hypothetical protein